MEYKKENFEQCLFNPFDKKILSIPRLKELSDDEKLLKYIICLYDPKSPLFKEFPDLKARKEQAALIAGYDFATDEKRLEELFSFQSPEIEKKFDHEGVEIIPDDKKTDVDIVMEFLQIVRSREWGTICAIEQTIWEFNQTLLTPIDIRGRDKDLVSAVNMKSQIVTSLIKLNEELDTLIMKFYGSDDDLKKAQSIQRFTPQSVAGRRKTNV